MSETQVAIDPQAILIQTVKPLINSVLTQIDLREIDEYTDLTQYAHQAICLVETLCGKVHLTGPQKKQLVLESMKRILIVTHASDHLSKEFVQTFVDTGLPALIDSAVWLANNSKAFTRSKGCLRPRPSKK